MAKTRINLTMDLEAFQVLKSVAKQEKRSLSSLMDYLVFNHLQDPLLYAEEQAKHHQREFMRWKDELDRLRELRKKNMK